VKIGKLKRGGELYKKDKKKKVPSTFWLRKKKGPCAITCTAVHPSRVRERLPPCEIVVCLLLLLLLVVLTCDFGPTGWKLRWNNWFKGNVRCTASTAKKADSLWRRWRCYRFVSLAWHKLSNETTSSSFSFNHVELCLFSLSLMSSYYHFPKRENGTIRSFTLRFFFLSPFLNSLPFKSFVDGNLLDRSQS
jgi:hypothetical protein